MNGELIGKGFELMLVGMGTVFVFLILVVVATSAMTALIQYLVGPQGTDSTSGGRVGQHGAGEDGVSPEELAAAIAAVHQHRCRP